MNVTTHDDPYLMILDLFEYVLNDLAGVLECCKDLLCIVQPVRVDAQHGMEVLNVR